MSNTFRRPMFRRGGEAMTGIMSNVTPRVNHAVGSPESFVTDYTQQLRDAAGPYGGVDPLTSWLLRAGPAMMNEPKKGGSLATILRATAEPTEKAIGDINKQAMGERDLRLAGAQMGLTQHGKESIWDKRIAAQNEDKINPLDAQILERADWYMKNKSVSEFVANNMATYDFDIGDKMRENFTIDLVIDSDIVPPPGKGRQKWVRKNTDNLGKYFFDPYDGTIKKIIMDPNDPNKKNLAFETFDATTFQPVDDAPDIEGDDVANEMSVSLTYEDAQTEAAKRGLKLLPPRPEDAGRGWIMDQKRQNPDAITVVELQEIIKKEKFSERYKHIKKKQRVR